jgi:hypothetical protein
MKVRTFPVLVSSTDRGSSVFSIDLAILLAFVPERILHVSRAEAESDLEMKGVLLVPISAYVGEKTIDSDNGQVSSDLNTVEN